MTFEEAVKQAVQHAKTQGEQIEQYIQTKQFVNAIDGFSGYVDMPACETILNPTFTLNSLFFLLYKRLRLTPAVPVYYRFSL